MHTRRSYRVWMGLSPSIELNHANGKSLCMPRRIAQKPQRIATSPALRRKSGSQQAAVLESAAKGALYRKSSRFAASGGASEPLAPRRPTSGRRESSLCSRCIGSRSEFKKTHLRPSSAQSTSRALADPLNYTTNHPFLGPLLRGGSLHAASCRARSCNGNVTAATRG